MRLIDVHHHFYPEGRDNERRPWSIAMTLQEMDANGVASAIGSLPPVPGASGAAGASAAREQNTWAAERCAEQPGRLGWFASLPLHDVDAALSETAYALDELGADGIGLPTNDGDVWLSDDRFMPLFAELDRRGAVVLFHPYATSRCSQLSKSYGAELVSAPWVEFPTNTSRLIVGLLSKGVIAASNRARLIFCHGGGTIASLLGRIAGFDGWDTVGPDRLERLIPGGVHAVFRSVYLDCAQAYAPEVFSALQTLVPASHLLFGSDYGYFPISHSVREIEALSLSAETLDAVGAGNAEQLFPRFRRL